MELKICRNNAFYKQKMINKQNNIFVPLKIQRNNYKGNLRYPMVKNNICLQNTKKITFQLLTEYFVSALHLLVMSLTKHFV